MATIRRTSHPHQYHLTVTRVFEEGEEALQDDDQDRKASKRQPFGLDRDSSVEFSPVYSPYLVDDERAFLIDQSMRFKKGVSAGATTFSWQGLSAVSMRLDFTSSLSEHNAHHSILIL